MSEKILSRNRREREALIPLTYSYFRNGRAAIILLLTTILLGLSGLGSSVSAQGAPAEAQTTVTVRPTSGATDSVVKDESFVVEVTRPGKDARGKIILYPGSIEVKFKTPSGQEKTLTLKKKGDIDSNLFVSEPTKIETAAYNPWNWLDAKNGETVKVSYGDSKTEFQVYDSEMQQAIGRNDETLGKLNEHFTKVKDEADKALKQADNLLKQTSDPAERKKIEQDQAAIEQARQIAQMRLSWISNARTFIHNPKRPSSVRDEALTNQARVAMGNRYIGLITSNDYRDLDPRAEYDAQGKAMDDAHEMISAGLIHMWAQATLGLYQAVAGLSLAGPTWTLVGGQTIFGEKATGMDRLHAARELLMAAAMMKVMSGMAKGKGAIESAREGEMTIGGEGPAKPGTVKVTGRGGAGYGEGMKPTAGRAGAGEVPKPSGGAIAGGAPEGAGKLAKGESFDPIDRRPSQTEAKTQPLEPEDFAKIRERVNVQEVKDVMRGIEERGQQAKTKGASPDEVDRIVAKIKAQMDEVDRSPKYKTPEEKQSEKLRVLEKGFQEVRDTEVSSTFKEWVKSAESALDKRAAEAKNAGVPASEVDRIVNDAKATAEVTDRLKSASERERTGTKLDVYEDANHKLVKRIFDKKHPGARTVEGDSPEMDLIRQVKAKASLEAHGKPQGWTKAELNKLDELSKDPNWTEAWERRSQIGDDEPGYAKIGDKADAEAVKQAAARSKDLKEVPDTSARPEPSAEARITVSGRAGEATQTRPLAGERSKMAKKEATQPYGTEILPKGEPKGALQGGPGETQVLPKGEPKYAQTGNQSEGLDMPVEPPVRSAKVEPTGPQGTQVLPKGEPKGALPGGPGETQVLPKGEPKYAQTGNQPAKTPETGSSSTGRRVVKKRVYQTGDGTGNYTAEDKYLIDIHIEEDAMQGIDPKGWKTETSQDGTVVKKTSPDGKTTFIGKIEKGQIVVDKIENPGAGMQTAGAGSGGISSGAGQTAGKATGAGQGTPQQGNDQMGKTAGGTGPSSQGGGSDCDSWETVQVKINPEKLSEEELKNIDPKDLFGPYDKIGSSVDQVIEVQGGNPDQFREIRNPDISITKISDDGNTRYVGRIGKDRTIRVEKQRKVKVAAADCPKTAMIPGQPASKPVRPTPVAKPKPAEIGSTETGDGETVFIVKDKSGKKITLVKGPDGALARPDGGSTEGYTLSGDGNHIYRSEPATEGGTETVKKEEKAAAPAPAKTGKAFTPAQQFEKDQTATTEKFDKDQSAAKKKFDEAQKKAKEKFDKDQAAKKAIADNQVKQIEEKFNNIEKTKQTIPDDLYRQIREAKKVQNGLGVKQREDKEKFEKDQQAAKEKFEKGQEAAQAKFEGDQKSAKANFDRSQQQAKAAGSAGKMPDIPLKENEALVVRDGKWVKVEIDPKTGKIVEPKPPVRTPEEAEKAQLKAEEKMKAWEKQDEDKKKATQAALKAPQAASTPTKKADAGKSKADAADEAYYRQIEGAQRVASPGSGEGMAWMKDEKGEWVRVDPKTGQILPQPPPQKTEEEMDAARKKAEEKMKAKEEEYQKNRKEAQKKAAEQAAEAEKARLEAQIKAQTMPQEGPVPGPGEVITRDPGTGEWVKLDPKTGEPIEVYKGGKWVKPKPGTKKPIAGHLVKETITDKKTNKTHVEWKWVPTEPQAPMSSTPPMPGTGEVKGKAIEGVQPKEQEGPSLETLQKAIKETEAASGQSIGQYGQVPQAEESPRLSTMRPQPKVDSKKMVTHLPGEKAAKKSQTMSQLPPASTSQVATQPKVSSTTTPMGSSPTAQVSKEVPSSPAAKTEQSAAAAPPSATAPMTTPSPSTTVVVTSKGKEVIPAPAPSKPSQTSMTPPITTSTPQYTAPQPTVPATPPVVLNTPGPLKSAQTMPSPPATVIVTPTGKEVTATPAQPSQATQQTRQIPPVVVGSTVPSATTTPAPVAQLPRVGETVTRTPTPPTVTVTPVTPVTPPTAATATPPPASVTARTLPTPPVVVTAPQPTIPPLAVGSAVQPRPAPTAPTTAAPSQPTTTIITDPSGRRWQRSMTRGMLTVTPIDPPRGTVYQYDPRTEGFVAQPAQQAPVVAMPLTPAPGANSPSASTSRTTQQGAAGALTTPAGQASEGAAVGLLP